MSETELNAAQQAALLEAKLRQLQDLGALEHFGAENVDEQGAVLKDMEAILRQKSNPDTD